MYTPTNTVVFESLGTEDSLPELEPGLLFSLTHLNECEISIESHISDSSYQEPVDADASECKKLVEMINSFLAGDDTGEFNEKSLAPLMKVRDSLKKMDVRKQLDEMLCKIDTYLEKISPMDTDSNGMNEGKNQVSLSIKHQSCYRELTKTRDLIQSCINRHTELYLMGQQCEELIDNTQLLKINIPDLSLPKVGNPFTNLISRLMTEVIKGVEKFAWLKGLGNKLIATCELFSNERNIESFCRKLRKSGIDRNLNTMLKGLGNTRKVMRGTLRRDTDMNLSGFNIIMKAYKDYRITYEEARADPGNKYGSAVELHTQMRKFGSSCIKPVTDRFKNLSKSEAWELMDAIHLMAIREFDLLQSYDVL